MINYLMATVFSLIIGYLNNWSAFQFTIISLMFAIFLQLVQRTK